MEIGYVIYALAGLYGLIMGSFAGATVWRLRARQLIQDDHDFNQLRSLKKSGSKLGADEAEALGYLQSTKVDRAEELKRLGGLTKPVKDDRSQCLSCGHSLAWFDLLPLVSWLSTGGKCRYCRAFIGRFEPLIEIATAVVFVTITYFFLQMYSWQTVTFILLGLWLAALTMLIILFVYDLKWFLLPDKVMFPFIGLSAVITAITLIVNKPLDITATLFSIAGSVAILGGLYFVLWFVSKGRWVGFGDVKLGIALGILLIDWRLGFLTLLLANLIGTLIVLPGLLTKRLSRTTQVPFGPFLIAGFLISLLWGRALLQGYESFSSWLSSLLLML